MNSIAWKKVLPHVIAIVVFLVVAVVYCRPALEGKVVNQSDMLQYKGMAQQSKEYKEKHGHYPLWIENAFGGMPGYTIGMNSPAINLGPVVGIFSLGLPQPINFFFIACVCFYILMVAMRIDPWIGVLTALAYAYSTYDPVIVVTGHVTKMMALMYAPGVAAGLLLLFRRKYVWGTVLLTLFFALQLTTNHLQIVYYTMITLGVVALFYLIDAFRKGQGKDAGLVVGLSALAVVIGLGTSALANLPVSEYSKETMRGGRTELTSNTSKQESRTGLSKDYAFQWSYGVGETMTLVVPNVYGGGSGGSQIGDNSKFAEVASQELGLPEDRGVGFANGYAYWGAQPFTSGPVYLGAIVVFLAILGMVFVKGWLKWGLVVAAVIGIVLSWGKNFAGLNYFLFDHLPFYNKFRAPAMALVIPQLVFPILAALGLNELFSMNYTRAELMKKFRVAAYITGGLLAVLVIFYFTADYGTTQDNQLKEQFVQYKMQQLSQGKQAGPDVQGQAAATGNQLIKALKQDRQSLYGSDLIRTILLIVVAAGLIVLFLKDKVKMPILLGGLIVLSTYDLLAVASRYLSPENPEHYVDATDFDGRLSPSPADQQISGDPDKNFRVFDEAAGSPFENALTSYHHNSLGGYSPAKLGLYQDLIENQLSKGNMQVFNMLNAKYFIQRNPQNGQPQAALNAQAFGPCWLVKSIHYVKDGNEEMKALDSINVRDTAIIQQQYASRVKFMPVADSGATIKLQSNDNDKLVYEFNGASNQFAVFSEIYYDKGWNAYLDGAKTEYCRVDYVLRGMSVPAGKHMIEFRFEPKSVATGDLISSASALVVYLLLIGAIVWEVRRRKKATATT